MSDLWIPGASGPLDDLVARIQLRIEAFGEATGSQPVVEVELRDGSRAVLRSIDAEPGFGFVTLSPHGDGGDGDDPLFLAAVPVRRERHEPEAGLGVYRAERRPRSVAQLDLHDRLRARSLAEGLDPQLDARHEVVERPRCTRDPEVGH